MQPDVQPAGAAANRSRIPGTMPGGAIMPTWLYALPAWLLAVISVLIFEGAALGGLWLARHYLLPRLHYHDGANEAVSGTIASIGVFYGITVGLIAVSVWNSYHSAATFASQEAADIATVYRDLSSYPEPPRTALQTALRDYINEIIQVDWPAHRRGVVPPDGGRLLDRFQAQLNAFEPANAGQSALHAETLYDYSQMVLARRLRLDVVGGALSGIMWFVIWAGAAISISACYFWRLEDPRLHSVLIGLMAGFLGIAIFLIVVNDRPFMGSTALTPASYQLVLDYLPGSQ
jgi:hypothetical protein